jgi:aminoglycoside phosphotransferase (APT) family kinase protein
MPVQPLERIGEGAMADVHAWAPGQVIKLFKGGIQQPIPAHEARMTRAAVGAGLPAPTVFGEKVVGGRFGIVLSRFDGPTLMHLSRTHAIGSDEAGSILAALAFSVHRTSPPEDVPTLHAFMKASLRVSDVPDHIAEGILSHIKWLPQDDGLCHSDLHPGNVIMTADGPKLIDWFGMVRAPFGYDLAVCHFLLSDLVPERVVDPERPRAINTAMQREYARLTGTSVHGLVASITPYLPIARCSALFAGLPNAQRQRQIDSIEADLGLETHAAMRLE